MHGGISMKRVSANRDEGHIEKGLAAGVIAGLAASLVMNQFQKLLGQLMENGEKSMWH